MPVIRAPSERMSLKLLQLLAARTSSLLNYSELSRISGLSQSILKRYLALLPTTVASVLYSTLVPCLYLPKVESSSLNST